MTLRWRKHAKQTGLSSVGAGPRGSDLWLDDENNYLASVNADGGTWLGPLKGWYFSVPSNEEKGIEYFNSYPHLYETEKEAKDAAKAYVLKVISKKTS